MPSEEVKASIIAQTKSKFHISFIKLMSYEVRAEKFDQRVVVLAKHGQRLMIFSNKTSPKLEVSLHYLDIKGIESNTPKELKIAYGENKSLRLVCLTEDNDVDEIVMHIGHQLKTVFPLIPLQSLIPRVYLLPSERTNKYFKKLDAHVINDLSACSGFSRMYICMCDNYACHLIEEIIWDLDTIYLSHDSRTLYLRDFDHLSLKCNKVHRDHVPLLGALQYNDWFTGVDASSMKMTGDALAEILKVIKRNTSITEWNLASTGLRSDFLQKFSSAITANLTSKIATLDLSGNAIEDKGLSYLSEAVANMAHGMHSINLSQCSVTTKGVNKLMEGVSQNHIMANTLHTLNLSSNNLRSEELAGLYQFLAQPNVVQVLNMSDTDSPLDQLVTALSRGSVQHLEELNVSGNPFSSKRSKDAKFSPSWKQFFSSALALNKINMSNCKLSPTALKELLVGLSANANKPSVSLDLSCNELKSEGGAVLGSCVGNLSNIIGLDLSDNGLDAHLADILPWFGKNGTIRHLSIGKNFSQLRNKALNMALDALVTAIQDDQCVLESLSLTDSKLRVDTTVVINALGSCSSLKSLDISGNQMGDIGAKMLAKALTINSSLNKVVWDRNGITAAGFRDVAQCLQRNFTMQEMPLPIFDISLCTKTSPDIIHKSSMQIQSCLQRNHAPQKMTYDQFYRLQQGFLISSTQAIIDKRVHDIHELLNTLCETDNLSPEEFNETKKLLADADKSKQILMALQTVAVKCEETPNQFTECVKEVTTSLNSAVNSQMEETRQEMVKVLGAECMTALEHKDNREVLEDGAKSRCSLGQSEISTLIDKHLVSDIESLMRAKNFTVALYIAESVIDKIVEMLSTKYNELKAKRKTCSGNEDRLSVITGAPDTIGTSGMTFLGDASVDESGSNRQSRMNTLRRRPQSVLVTSPDNPPARDFTQEVTMDPEEDVIIPEVEEPAHMNMASAEDTSASAKETVSTVEPEPLSNGVTTKESTESMDVGGEVSAASLRPRLDSPKSPGRALSLVDESVMDGKKSGSESKTTGGATLRSGTGRRPAGTNNRRTICTVPSTPPTTSKEKLNRSASLEASPPVPAKPKLISPTTPHTTPPKPKPKSSSLKLRSSKTKEPDDVPVPKVEAPVAKVEVPVAKVEVPVPKVEEVPVAKPRKPTATPVPSAATEPEIKTLPGVESGPALKHLAKDRPKRAKKQAGRRPMPAVTTVENGSEDGEDVDDFFKPVTVSQTPVVVTTPSANKPKSGSKPDKPEKRPKVKSSSSVKEKIDSDKQKGSRNSTSKSAIASGISNFFKRKHKPEKTIDTPGSAASEPAPAKPEASAPANESQNASADIPKSPVKPDKPEAPEEKPAAAPADVDTKSASLERSSTSDVMSSSAISATSEAEGAPIPAPKRRQVGIGLPGMSTGLLAEMQSKRKSMQPPSQPKAQPRAAKSEETPTSPPARPQPPVLKTSTSSGDGKESSSTTPPARPTPPRPTPTAAPRDSTGSISSTASTASVSAKSATTPAKPVLRPKPPAKMPKPAKPARPATVIDMPTNSRPVSSKTAPPKPPPPNKSKRSSHVEPQVSSPISPPAVAHRPFPTYPKSPTNDSTNQSDVSVESTEAKPVCTPEMKELHLSDVPRISVSSPTSPSVKADLDKEAEAAKETESVKAPEPAKRAAPMTTELLQKAEEAADTPLPTDVPEPIREQEKEVALGSPEEAPASHLDNTSEVGGSLRGSSSQGDLADDSEDTPVTRGSESSGSARDSIAEELSARLRDGNRNSALRLSNGSVTQDKGLSSPTSQSAHIEDGPVLQPPPPSATKRQNSQEAKVGTEGESGDVSIA